MSHLSWQKGCNSTRVLPELILGLCGWSGLDVKQKPRCVLWIEKFLVTLISAAHVKSNCESTNWEIEIYEFIINL